MYVDESGDVGMRRSPTDIFVLSGLVVHELRWRDYLQRLVAFRRRMRTAFGLKLREEVHASAMVNKPGPLARIKRNDRLAIMRMLADELASMQDCSVINVVIDKRGKPPGYDPFEHAWRALIQRFENTISRRNFPGPVNADERGMILPDRTDDKKLTQLVRRMRYFNPVPSRFLTVSRNLTLHLVIEDPHFVDSRHSFFIQAVDVVAYLLFQSIAPNPYMRKKGGAAYFARLDPVLCKVASTTDPQGIVRL